MLLVFNQPFIFVLLLLISMASGLPSMKRQTRPDRICGETRSVLCVNGVLTSMATAAMNIEKLANDIERHILNRSHTAARLEELVKSEMNTIRIHLPESKYHEVYHKLPNVDKEFFGYLLKEGHFALSFYYNSMDDILEKNRASGYETDSKLKEILGSLSSDMICQYRSILAVYSLEWQLSYQVARIQLSTKLYQEAESIVRDAHTLIVTRLLHIWMRRIRDVIDNLNRKYH